MHHVLSAQQFDTETLGEVFERAEHFRAQVDSSDGRRALAGRYAGEMMVNLFYQPSTRTRTSFGLAARRLGLGVEATENAREFSSAAKGETLEDTIRVMNEYSPGIIVLRHHETGAASRAAAVSEAAIINAGDGKGEHPTQAILDLFTIREQKGHLDDLKVVIGGDLARGRTARSLARLLSHYKGNHVKFVAAPGFQVGQDVKDYLDDHETGYEEFYDMYEALRDADVVYWTRMQKEYAEADESDQAEEFILDQAALSVMPTNAIIMHPLPKITEIHPVVDADPRAVYFRQAGNGMYVRMALLDMILESS